MALGDRFTDDGELLEVVWDGAADRKGQCFALTGAYEQPPRDTDRYFGKRIDRKAKRWTKTYAKARKEVNG